MSLYPGQVKDSNIDYLLKRQWIEPIMFVSAGAAVTAAAPVTLTTGFVGGGLGAASLLEFNGSNFAALRFNNANASTASYVWRVLDVDNRWPVYARIAWTSDAIATQSVVASFTALFGLQGRNTLPTSVTTAFNTAIVTDAKTTGVDAWQWTRWGVVAGALATGPFAFETFPTTVEAVAFNFAVSSFSNGDITTVFVWVHGVELAYTPRFTWGDGSGREARYLEQPLQVGPAEGGAQFGIRR